MSGRAVLITGAGSGIGEALSRRFGVLGERVGVLDLEPDRAERVAAAIREAGGAAQALAADVSKEAALSAEVDRFASWAGGLDVVVSNAGIVLRKDLRSTTVEEWDRTMEVNVRGAFLLARAALPHLERRGRGSIIFTTSVVAKLGFGLPAYTASKGALEALVRELAGELAHLGIRVNAVAPGTVEGTRVTEKSLADPEVYERTRSAIPLGRISRADDIVGAVEFLASDGAQMITGQSIGIDGGLSTIVYAMQRPKGAGK